MKLDDNRHIISIENLNGSMGFSCELNVKRAE